MLDPHSKLAIMETINRLQGKLNKTNSAVQKLLNFNIISISISLANIQGRLSLR